MRQPDLFKSAEPVPQALPLTPTERGEPLLACPRCAKAKTDAWGWVVTLNGPFRGLRCDDCWEAEPCEF